MCKVREEEGLLLLLTVWKGRPMLLNDMSAVCISE